MASSGKDGEWMEGVVMGLLRYKKGSDNIVENKYYLNKLLKEESIMVKTGKFLPSHVILFHTQACFGECVDGMGVNQRGRFRMSGDHGPRKRARSSFNGAFQSERTLRNCMRGTIIVSGGHCDSLGRLPRRCCAAPRNDKCLVKGGHVGPHLQNKYGHGSNGMDGSHGFKEWEAPT